MMAFSFLLSFIPAQLSAETNALIKDKTTKNESAEAKVLLSRLDEIKAMIVTQVPKAFDKKGTKKAAPKKAKVVKLATDKAPAKKSTVKKAANKKAAPKKVAAKKVATKKAVASKK